ncbi:protein Shroom2-like [Schistocerca nitens]|uniref:protein Shroom2-like n=1 Tax=Schistocerca nitens TaxID=7011 RepID=UPI002118B833|nr:protein Shroom2-like [Schistocerca nitens]
MVVVKGIVSDGQRLEGHSKTRAAAHNQPSTAAGGRPSSPEPGSCGLPPRCRLRAGPAGRNYVPGRAARGGARPMHVNWAPPPFCSPRLISHAGRSPPAARRPPPAARRLQHAPAAAPATVPRRPFEYRSQCGPTAASRQCAPNTQRATVASFTSLQVSWPLPGAIVVPRQGILQLRLHPNSAKRWTQIDGEYTVQT